MKNSNKAKGAYNMTNLGEIKAYHYLLSQGYFVEDLTGVPEFWNQDIDFSAERNGKIDYIEVKWDNRIHQTNNMYVETETDIDKSKAGWYLICKADYIFYGDSYNNLFYKFKFSDLKAYIEKHNGKIEQRKAGDYNYKHTLKKVSNGYLVNIKSFSQEYNVEIIYLDDWK